jgi:hypothetical protein
VVISALGTVECDNNFLAVTGKLGMSKTAKEVPVSPTG